MSKQLVQEALQPVVDVANIVTKVQLLAPKLNQVVPAYLALSDAEKEEVKKEFELALDLVDDSIEKTVETAVKVLVDVQPAVTALKDGISLSDVFTLLSVLKQVQADIGTKA